MILTIAAGIVIGFIALSLIPVVLVALFYVATFVIVVGSQMLGLVERNAK